MRLIRSLLVFIFVLVAVSSAVFADPAESTEAVEDETYKEVLLPNTTIVTGYPDQEEFYVVTKGDMPTLLTELNHRREMDELRYIAKEHYKLHDAIKLNPDMVLALNNRMSQIAYDHRKSLNDISFAAEPNEAIKNQGKNLRFNYFPHTASITPKAEQLDSHAFAVRMAGLFKQTRFNADTLSQGLNKVADTQSAQPKLKKAKLKKHRVVSQRKSGTFKTKRYRVIKRATEVRSAPRFRIIEYSDIVKKSHKLASGPKKKKLRQAATGTRKKVSHTRHASRKPIRKKVAHGKRAKRQKFVVKAFTFDASNKLVVVDSSKKSRPHLSPRKRKTITERAGKYASR